MDENPCAETAQEDARIGTFFAAVALTHMIEGNEDDAVEWLKRVPRAERGRLNVALEDLSMKLSRLGNQ